MNVFLSSYPLTRDALDRLQPKAADVVLTLSELRLAPLHRIVPNLRKTSSEVLTVVVQEASERAVLPLMLVLAGLARTGRIQVTDLSDGSTRPMSRLAALTGLLGTVAATVSGVATVIRLSLQSRMLMAVAPQVFGAPASRRALYLKSNLMLGVKAGGSIGHIAGVANELRRLDAGMTVLAPEPPPMVDAQARFVPIPTLQTYGIPPEVNHFRFNWRCFDAGDAVLKASPFGFIYQRLSLGNLSGVLLARRHRIPLVLEYNGSEVWISANWGHQLRFKRLAAMIEDCNLRHAHRVVTVSQVLADDLRARGVPAERIVWYPNCIDPALFDPAVHAQAGRALRERLGIAPDELVVMFLGTFGVWHGAEVLAEAARRYLAAQDDPARRRVRFLFVGDGLRLAAVRETLEAAIAAGRVILTGLVPQAQAPTYLAAADVFASPHVPSKDGSKFFGSPTKLFEYMAMGRPIIASRLDQIAEVLEPAAGADEGADAATPLAVMVEPGDPEAIVAAIVRLRDDPVLGARIAQAARAHACRHYTWQRHVDHIVASLDVG